MIRELRILPPLAIARFGAAPTRRWTTTTPRSTRTAARLPAAAPAETFEVDPATGEIARTFVPNRVIFTENGLVRPVAPFLELWALTDDDQLEPLTADLLAEDQAAVADLRWRVEVANLKVSRRTDDDADRGDRGQRGHRRSPIHPLAGVADNFWPDKSIPFGSVQFIRPDARTQRSGCASSGSQVRLRREPHPPAGPPADPNARHRLRRQPRRLAGLRGLRPPAITVPGQIYALDAQGSSRGYLDDGCDGLIRAS